MAQTEQHIIIIGMMGTGKTSVGRELARQIHLPWQDTDLALEQKWGCSIRQYFAKYGESQFREEETRMLQTLLQSPPSVITTGGGIVLRPVNQAYMKQKGWVVHLTAHPEVLVRRLSHDQSRPLIQGNVAERVWQLFEERKGKYDFADVTIDTSHLSIIEVVQQIQKLWEEKCCMQ